jgi:hypothetical protein
VDQVPPSCRTAAPESGTLANAPMVDVLFTVISEADWQYLDV